MSTWTPTRGAGGRGGYRRLVITRSGGIVWRPAGGGTDRPDRAPSVTPHGGDGDERSGAEPDDQDGDIVPGVVARGEPAYPIGALVIAGFVGTASLSPRASCSARSWSSS